MFTPPKALILKSKKKSDFVNSEKKVCFLEANDAGKEKTLESCVQFQKETYFSLFLSRSLSLSLSLFLSLFLGRPINLLI
jgi:hypothetical protein